MSSEPVPMIGFLGWNVTEQIDIGWAFWVFESTVCLYWYVYRFELRYGLSKSYYFGKGVYLVRVSFMLVFLVSTAGNERAGYFLPCV